MDDTAVSTRERQQVDSLHEVRRLTSLSTDTGRLSVQVEADAQRQTGRGVSWVVYAMMVVLSIVSVGLIIKK